MAISINIYYHTDYDNDSLSASYSEVTLNVPLTEDLLPKLTNENYLFQGWYSTPTFNPESKVTVGTIVTDDLHLYAKWVLKNELDNKMTLLANEIRELSGTTEVMGLDAMEIHINEANIEISSQADLIAQIRDALDGKAIGNGGNTESEYYSSGIIECSSISNSMTIPSSGPTGGLSLTYLSNNISTYMFTTDYDRNIYSLYVGPDFKGYVAIPCRDDNNANIGLETDILTYDSTSGLVSTSAIYDYFSPGIYVYIVW